MAEKLTPKDRADWLTLRRQDVTASQIAATVSAHPYVTAYQLWAEKTGKLIPGDLDSPAMRRGRLLESVAADRLYSTQFRPPPPRKLRHG